MKKARPFFITRQRMAERLAMAGIELFPCENIYDPNQKAWKCALTKEAAQEIKAFYDEIGKAIPDCVTDALNA